MNSLRGRRRSNQTHRDDMAQQHSCCRVLRYDGSTCGSPRRDPVGFRYRPPLRRTADFSVYASTPRCRHDRKDQPPSRNPRGPERQASRARGDSITQRDSRRTLCMQPDRAENANRLRREWHENPSRNSARKCYEAPRPRHFGLRRANQAMPETAHQVGLPSSTRSLDRRIPRARGSNAPADS